MTSTRHWLVTADRRRATLFWCQPTPRGRLHVEPERTLESEFEDIHEHHRPYLLGRGPTANAAQRPPSVGHEDEEELRRFAKRLAGWLGDACKQLRPDRVTLFAARRFASFLRAEVPNGREPITHIVEAELTNMRPSELAEHPAVAAAIASAPSAQRARGRTPPAL